MFSRADVPEFNRLPNFPFASTLLPKIGTKPKDTNQVVRRAYVAHAHTHTHTHTHTPHVQGARVQGFVEDE